MSKEDGKPELVRYEKVVEGQGAAHHISTVHPQNTPIIAVIISMPPAGGSIVELTMPSELVRATDEHPPPVGARVDRRHDRRPAAEPEELRMSARVGRTRWKREVEVAFTREQLWFLRALCEVSKKALPGDGVGQLPRILVDEVTGKLTRALDSKDRWEVS